MASADADAVVLLARGEVAAAGTPQEVIRPEVLEPVYETPVEVRTDETTGRPYVLPRPPGSRQDTDEQRMFNEDG